MAVDFQEMQIIMREGYEAWCKSTPCLNIRHDPQTGLCWECKQIRGVA